jgi:hypothetical protein
VLDDLVVFLVRADRAGLPQVGEALASRREVPDQALIGFGGGRSAGIAAAAAREARS